MDYKKELDKARAKTDEDLKTAYKDAARLLTPRDLVDALEEVTAKVASGLGEKCLDETNDAESAARMTLFTIEIGADITGLLLEKLFKDKTNT